MQNITFDDSDLAAANPVATWIDQSPRLAAAKNGASPAPPVTEEDMYAYVAVSAPQASAAIHIPPASAPFISLHAMQQQHHQQHQLPLPARRGRRPSAQPKPIAEPIPAPDDLSSGDGVMRGRGDQFLPARSAVEEARLRAQREAESYAVSRRDPSKREAVVATMSMAGPSNARPEPAQRRPAKRAKPDGARGDPGRDAAQPIGRRRVPAQQPSDKNDDIDQQCSGSVENETEAEKQERYQRRLDMNRESAAVSRVRRRAYVKELEERLAVVEAEKFQLQGKLDIVMTQVDARLKQIEHMFLSVANGGQQHPQHPQHQQHQHQQRPSYPPSGDTTQL